MSDYTPSIEVTDEVVGLMAAAIKVTVRDFPGHVSDRMADRIARSALHAMTPWLGAHGASVRAEERERIARNIEADRGDVPWSEDFHVDGIRNWIDSRDATKAARIAREGA